MSYENKKLRTPEENYEAASFELAVYRMMKRDRDEIESNASEEVENELLQVTEENTPRMLDFIDKQMKRKNKRTSLRRQSLRILRIAALIILVLNIGLTIAVAASSGVRAKVIEYLMEINDSYMRMGFSETDEMLAVPADWPENYYPTYIPDGYAVTQYVPHTGLSMIIYEDANGNILSIEVCSVSSGSQLNSEGATISGIFIHGVTAIVLQQSYGQTDIVWAIGDHYFIVSAVDYDTALAVAKSMALISR